MYTISHMLEMYLPSKFPKVGLPGHRANPSVAVIRMTKSSFIRVVSFCIPTSNIGECLFLNTTDCAVILLDVCLSDR